MIYNNTYFSEFDKTIYFQQYRANVKLGNVYCVKNSSNDFQALDEVIREFKINVQPQTLFSRCMDCNCDTFLVASKIQMIRLKYYGVQIPNSLMQFTRREQEFSKIAIPDSKFIRSWRHYDNELATDNGSTIQGGEIHDTTLSSYQTFFICNDCAKIYWDGAHFRNGIGGGKFEGIFNLFPGAE